MKRKSIKHSQRMLNLTDFGIFYAETKSFSTWLVIAQDIDAKTFVFHNLVSENEEQVDDYMSYNFPKQIVIDKQPLISLLMQFAQPIPKYPSEILQ